LGILLIRRLEERKEDVIGAQVTALIVKPVRGVGTKAAMALENRLVNVAS